MFRKQLMKSAAIIIWLSGLVFIIILCWVLQPGYRNAEVDTNARPVWPMAVAMSLAIPSAYCGIRVCCSSDSMSKSMKLTVVFSFVPLVGTVIIPIIWYLIGWFGTL